MITKDFKLLIFLFLVVAILARVVHTYLMSTFIQKVVRAYNQLRGLFPSPLPTGMTEFESWVDSIRSTYKLPTENRDSVTWTFATMIMHFGPNVASKSKYYFVRAFHAAAAKQIAGGAFTALKERQLEANRKEAENQAKKATEVTGSEHNVLTVASNGSQQ